MYNRSEKSFRDFIIFYGPDGIGKYKLQARSSLEAGIIFQGDKPGELMFDIEDKR